MVVISFGNVVVVSRIVMVVVVVSLGNVVDVVVTVVEVVVARGSVDVVVAGRGRGRGRGRAPGTALVVVSSAAGKSRLNIFTVFSTPSSLEIFSAITSSESINKRTIIPGKICLNIIADNLLVCRHLLKKYFLL